MTIQQDALKAILSRKDAANRVEQERRMLRDLQSKMREAENRLVLAQRDLEAATIREEDLRLQIQPETWNRIFQNTIGPTSILQGRR